MTKKKQVFHFTFPWRSNSPTLSQKPQTPNSNSQIRQQHATSSSDQNPHFGYLGSDPTQLNILSLSGSDNEADKVVVEAIEGSPMLELEIEKPLNSPRETACKPSFPPVMSQSTLGTNLDITQEYNPLVRDKLKVLENPEESSGPIGNIYQLKWEPELENKNEINEVINSSNKPLGSNVSLTVPLEIKAKGGNEIMPSSYSEGNQTETTTSYFMNTNDTSGLDTYTPNGYDGEKRFVAKEIEEEIYKFVRQLRCRKKERLGSVITLIGENNGVFMHLGPYKEMEASKLCVNNTIQGINDSVEIYPKKRFCRA